MSLKDSNEITLKIKCELGTEAAIIASGVSSPVALASIAISFGDSFAKLTLAATCANSDSTTPGLFSIKSLWTKRLACG